MSMTDPFLRTRVVVLGGSRHHQGLMRTMLRHLGFRQVDVFLDGDDALRHLGQIWVDVVLVDLQLPRGNGVEWVRTLRRRRGLANRDVAVVMTSGRAVRAVIEPAVVAGIDGFLVQPMSPRTLEIHLAGVLHRIDPYVAGPDAYWGPDFRQTRRRLRWIERGALGRPERDDGEGGLDRRAPFDGLPRGLPGLDVEIVDRSGYHGERLFLD